MPRELEPLYFAILRHFVGGNESCTTDVIDALRPDYSSYKLLTPRDVEEALDTAKENGILEETRADTDNDGALRIYYQITDFGRDMIRRYLD